MTLRTTPQARQVLMRLLDGFELIDSAARSWLSSPQKFNVAPVPHGVFAELVANELVEPDRIIGPFQVYRISEKGRFLLGEKGDS